MKLLNELVFDILLITSLVHPIHVVLVYPAPAFGDDAAVTELAVCCCFMNVGLPSLNNKVGFAVDPVPHDYICAIAVYWLIMLTLQLIYIWRL